MMKQWEQHGSGSMEGNDNIAEVWGGRCIYGVPGNKRDGTQWFTPSHTTGAAAVVDKTGS